MKVFFGGAIQGLVNKEERLDVNSGIINSIKDQGFEVVTEHVTGLTLDDRYKLLEIVMGQLPPKGLERTTYIRNKLIEFIEGDIDAAVFEVSVPSLGTGIEIAHAYMRPDTRKTEIPILFLYQKNYWPNKLSSMIRGLSREQFPRTSIIEYSSIDDAKKHVKEFLDKI